MVAGGKHLRLSNAQRPQTGVPHNTEKDEIVNVNEIAQRGNHYGCIENPVGWRSHSFAKKP